MMVAVLTGAGYSSLGCGSRSVTFTVIDPADRVQRWARGALEDWARSQTALSPDMVKEREALVQSILKALAEAARDKILRAAAMQRVAANKRLASEG
jgi:hypothetical protein